MTISSKLNKIKKKKEGVGIYLKNEPPLFVVFDEDGVERPLYSKFRGFCFAPYSKKGKGNYL